MALFAAGILFAWPLGSCNLGQVDVSSSISISARDVLTGIIVGAIIDPLEQAVITGVDEILDELENDDG
jgi:hypothetical protein